MDCTRIAQERDLYLGLLDLNAETDREAFLARALALIVGTVGAKQGYLELFSSDGNDASWYHATGFSGDEVERIRTLVSRGVIAHAVATGTVVRTQALFLDPRFRDRESVQRSKADAVLCAPIGRDPPVGVLYLQGQTEPHAFTDEEALRVENFARRLAPIAGIRFQEQTAPQSDRTAPYRKRLKLAGLVGASAALAKLFQDLDSVARLNVSVLLTGENGTGKSVVAAAIHANSPRVNEPFMAVNCAAIPENLIESELFGVKKGAFTDATRDIEGKVSAANGGTLLLDEIGDLPMKAQGSLLQFLQTKEYSVLGESRLRKADVRIIAATNVDLEEAVREKRFREDLLFRLNVVSIRVPSLAERREDLAQLALYFCEKALKAHDLPRVELSPDALRSIAAAEWRGNVRQLENAVVAAAIRAAGQGLTQIQSSHLFREATDATNGRGAVQEPAPNAEHGTFQEETRQFQKALLARALKAADWNVATAARQLDITRGHVYALIKAFGLTRDR
jgi:transcriptional regulator with GAF, ATPase, and Fis domain